MSELVKGCRTCVYGVTCSQPVFSTATTNRDDCLPTYKHYEKGDPAVRLIELQRSGEINIVIGDEGEHEVNANWSIEEAYKYLADVCNECGGLVTKEGLTQLYLMKPYGPGFVIEWMHDKLYKISIRKHIVWWTVEGTTYIEAMRRRQMVE